VRKFLLIALLCVSGNAGAVGTFKTGNELLSYCTASPRDVNYFFNYGYCVGYIASADDTHDSWVVWGNLPRKFCVPDGVTLEQLVRVVVKHLETRPAELHLTAGSHVLNALKKAFPCPE